MFRLNIYHEIGEGNTRARYRKPGTPEVYVFKYDLGNEHKLLEMFLKTAKNKDYSFSWVDAASLSGEVAKGLTARLQKFLRKSPLRELARE